MISELVPGNTTANCAERRREEKKTNQVPQRYIS